MIKNYIKLKKSLIIMLSAFIFVGGTAVQDFSNSQKIKSDLSAGFDYSNIGSNLLIIQENAVYPVSDLTLPKPKVVKEMTVIATAYSSTVWQTDDTPFITAAGTRVRDGIIANNLLPFGTKVRIPDLYGNKIFTVEDRMHSRKGNYQIDVWFPELQQAKNFGAKRTYIEILEN